MGEKTERQAPVSGSCVRCGCRLGFHAAKRGNEWLCCGPCAGSDRCSCGCKPAFTRTSPSDDFVPGRRMFGARREDGLNSPSTDDGQAPQPLKRTFPFADPHRGT